MARARKQSDDVYNARRRFRRQAERFLVKAEKSSGLERARYEAQARTATANAIRTYSKGQKVQGQVKKLATRLNLSSSDVDKIRSGNTSSVLKRLVEKSKSALSGTGKQSRDEMARDILNSGNIGSRFYGGLVQIWDADPESRQHPNKSILEFFGVESLMDVLEIFEREGIDLYSPDSNENVYLSSMLRLQQFILITKRINDGLR